MQIADFESIHIPDILEVEKMSFSHPWTEKMFEEEISGKFSVYRVVIKDGKAIAYMGMWVLADEGHITNIAVSKNYRRQGVASLLLKDFINLAKERNLAFMTLEVRASNEAARALYSSFGFCEVGRRKKYYENTEDAILMTKYFKEVE